MNQENLSYGWEMTDTDLRHVLHAHDLHPDPEALASIRNEIDEGVVEEAALGYNDMSDQSDSALQEIEQQLFDNGILSGERKFTGVNG